MSSHAWPMAQAPDAQALEMMLHRTAQAERVEHDPALRMRLIMKRARRLAAMQTRRAHGLPEIIFAQRHSAGSGAEHQRNFVGRFPAGLLPRFDGGEQQQRAGAVEPRRLPGAQKRRGHFFRQVNFRRRFHALAAGIEQRHRTERRFSGAKSLRIFFPADAERRHDARAGDDDARRLSGQWMGRKIHALKIIGPGCSPAG